MTYVPGKLEGKIMEAAARYQRIQHLLNQLSDRILKKLMEDR